MKLFAAFAIIVSSGVNAHASAMNDSFNKIGTALCDKTIAEKNSLNEYKSLKLKGTKIEGICLLTVKTALSSCATETSKIYNGSLSSKEKDKVSKFMRSSLQFCADYSDVVATEIVNTVLNTVVAEKITVDEAANKVVKEALK